MSPPSVGLVLQGTEAPMWDTFSSVLTHSSARSGGPTHGASCACVHVMRAYHDVRTSGLETYVRVFLAVSHFLFPDDPFESFGWSVAGRGDRRADPSSSSSSSRWRVQVFRAYVFMRVGKAPLGAFLETKEVNISARPRINSRRVWWIIYTWPGEGSVIGEGSLLALCIRSFILRSPKRSDTFSLRLAALRCLVLRAVIDLAHITVYVDKRFVCRNAFGDDALLESPSTIYANNFNRLDSAGKVRTDMNAPVFYLSCAEADAAKRSPEILLTRITTGHLRDIIIERHLGQLAINILQVLPFHRAYSFSQRRHIVAVKMEH